MSTFCRLLLNRGCLCLILMGFSLGFPCQSTHAQPTTDLKSTALALAPQDAAFFATSINLERSWGQFLAGSFVRQVRSVAYVKALEREIADQWANPQGPALQLKATLENPNVKSLLSLAADMCSQEFFVYGESQWCETIEGLMAFQNRMMGAMQNDPEAFTEFFNDLKPEDVKSIRIPTTVLGFRLSDDANARMQLDQLEGILRFVGGQQAELKSVMDKLKRRDLRDGQTLTLTLDTSLIPMEQLDEEQRQIAERAVELLEGRSLSLALGVKNKILLIALGEQTDLLAAVGSAQSTLLDHPTLDILEQAERSELRSIAFTSKRWRESQWQANFGNYFRNLSGQFSVVLKAAREDVPEAELWIDQINRDAQWLDTKLREFIPEFGDQLAWSRAIPGGMEGWSYDWNQNTLLANGAPLQILNHAGTRPLMLVGLKQAAFSVPGEICDYFLERIPEHVRRFIATAEQEPEERELALQVFERTWPLLVESLDIYRKQIGPALDQRESAFVAAAGWSTRSLGSSIPPAEEALTLPELAVACRVTDRQQFIDGCAELYGVFDRLVEVVRDLYPDEIPADYVVPRPIEESVGGATVYSYAELTEVAELDGFKPQVSVADQVLVIGYSDRQVRDMVESKPLSTRPAWLADDSPAAVVTFVDYAGIFAAARPWILYGLSFTGMPLDEPFTQAPVPVPSANDLLQIWDCFSSAGIAAGTTRVDDKGPTVSRWVWVGR
jgi:hypothetical protein